jgi:hypothetical protein
MLLAKEHPRDGERDSCCKRNSRKGIETEQRVHLYESLLAQVHCDGFDLIVGTMAKCANPQH